MDWDFTLFSAERLDRDHPYGLRRHRCFSSDRLYHYVIIADLVLRFSWLWRVLPGLAWLPESESGLFMLMFLEVVRRWMWVFFRVETEWGMFHCFTLMHWRFYLPHDSLTQFSFSHNSPDYAWTRPRRSPSRRIQSQTWRGLKPSLPFSSPLERQ